MILSGGIIVRKCVLILITVLLLSGCSAEPTFETIADDHVQSVMQEERGVLLSIPEEAAAQMIQGDAGTIYLCDGFEVTTQILAAGDLNGTVQTLTGFESDDLTVMATAATDCTRYECVWSAAGESGDMVGRAVILDDGIYHYCLTVTADAGEASSLQEIWLKIIESFSLA